jgi:hypothetical protein
MVSAPSRFGKFQKIMFFFCPNDPYPDTAPGSFFVLISHEAERGLRRPMMPQQLRMAAA